MEQAKATAPTGCYKCGRPGHWSRDCPDSNPNPTSNFTNKLTNSNPSRSFPPKPSNFNPKPIAEKPKKVPRSRPKLTPEILVKDDNGLAYILRYFPHHFKYRGRGHEVRDLGNLIRLYSEWHSRLIPYYSFDQFVHKVEQVAATKRVKTCIRDLREKVASGGDPTKLHESAIEDLTPDVDQDLSTHAEAMPMDSEGPQQGNSSSKNANEGAVPEGLLQEVYNNVIEEQPQILSSDTDLQNKNNGASCFNEVLITEEQRARMEANRLKALERAAARARVLQSA